MIGFAGELIVLSIALFCELLWLLVCMVVGLLFYHRRRPGTNAGVPWGLLHTLALLITLPVHVNLFSAAFNVEVKTQQL